MTQRRSAVRGLIKYLCMHVDTAPLYRIFSFNKTAVDQTSSTCYTKICCNNSIPSTSKVRANLGPSLARVFFAYSHDDTKDLLDLSESLKSPKPCFPVPADDSLDDDEGASLTKKETTQLDLHDNILKIGESILARIRKEIEENLRAGIEKQSQEKFHMYQAKKRLEAERNILELHAKYKNYIELVEQELEKQLEIEWANIMAECTKNTQKAVVQERMNVTHDMMQKMRIEIAHVVESLYKEFEESFRAQRETIIADFNGIMRKKHVELHKDKQEFEKRISRDLFIQKHQHEMQSTVDIIYVLCLERLRSCREKHAMHTYFQKQIDGFRELIVQLNNILTMMREEIVSCHMEKKLLEEKLCDITTQFQKFINFVFHAVPGQAEYLLPLEFQQLIPSNSNEKKDSMEKNL